MPSQEIERRDEMERVAERIAQQTVALARAEIRLDLNVLRDSIREDIRAHNEQIETLLHEKLDGPIAGMTAEQHAVAHLQIANMLQSAEAIKRDIVRRVVSIIFALVISALVTMYFAAPNSAPAMPNKNPVTDTLKEVLDDVVQ